MKSISVTLEKSKETKGTYLFDSPDPNAAVTSVYVRKSEFDSGAVPKRLVITVRDQPPNGAETAEEYWLTNSNP